MHPPTALALQVSSCTSVAMTSCSPANPLAELKVGSCSSEQLGMGLELGDQGLHLLVACSYFTLSSVSAYEGFRAAQQPPLCI